jgi:hypothetical protein
MLIYKTEKEYEENEIVNGACFSAMLFIPRRFVGCLSRQTTPRKQ